MKKKFLVSLALIAGLGITGFASTANAGNVKDTISKYTFSTSGSVDYTNSRPKYDSTSAYMLLESVTDGAGAFKVKVVKSNRSDFSRYWWSEPFGDGRAYKNEQYIPNYAYEDAGYGVSVLMKAQGHGGCTGSGTWDAVVYWSPDSV